ncbi:MAG TPA: hypothetical protein VK461_14445 [Acidimicrobiales bacterium]|nr:hypothetical protein [Acidimicrobiales bacterium]
MRLDELAHTTRLFGEMAGDDTASDDLRAVTGKRIDLRDPMHAKAMLVWLNKWGCRQFAIAHHDAAAQMLGDWGSEWVTRLPPPGASLAKLKPRQLAVAADAYADVKGRTASTRPTKSGGVAIVTVGATGAAKLLHALRPRVLPPWDDPIRVALGLDGARGSYLAYLERVQDDVRSIEAEAAARGITNIPVALGRPKSSLPKMIDEHYWITLTRGLPADPPLDDGKGGRSKQRRQSPDDGSRDRRA